MVDEERINSLERKAEVMDARLGELEKLVTVFQVHLERSNEIQEEANNTLKSLSSTIVSVQLAITNMNSKISITGDNVKESENKIIQLNDNIEHLKEDIRKVEERGKFDILEYVKEKAMPSLIGGGFLWMIYEAVMKLLDLFGGNLPTNTK